MLGQKACLGWNKLIIRCSAAKIMPTTCLTVAQHNKEEEGHRKNWFHV